MCRVADALSAGGRRSRSAPAPSEPVSTPILSSRRKVREWSSLDDHPAARCCLRILFEAQSNCDALVELSRALKVIAWPPTKIAQKRPRRPRALGRAPASASSFLPELQKGSSIMPGKVNPAMPEVVPQVSRAGERHEDDAISGGGLQGQLELNVRSTQIARNLLQSIHLLLDRVARRSPRSASTASRSTRRAPSARPSRRSRSPPRSTSTSATTRGGDREEGLGVGAHPARHRDRGGHEALPSTTASSTYARSRRGIRPSLRRHGSSALALVALRGAVTAASRGGSPRGAPGRAGSPGAVLNFTRALPGLAQDGVDTRPGFSVSHAEVGQDGVPGSSPAEESDRPRSRPPRVRFPGDA